MIELTRTRGPPFRHLSFYYIDSQTLAAVLDMTGGRTVGDHIVSELVHSFVNYLFICDITVHDD